MRPKRVKRRRKTFERQIRDIPDDVLNSVVQWIEPYTVFLIYRGQFAGSGTLVNCKDLFGVLTAHHVPEKHGFFRAGYGDSLGLCIDSKTHFFSIPVDYLERIDIGVPVNDEEGPDMTFLKIPPGNHLETIRAKRMFWKLDHDRKTRIKICKSTSGAWCLSYHADEKTQTEQTAEGNFLTFRADVGWGGPKRIYEMHGFDFYELGLDPANEAKGVPESFKGASGGGVWKVPLSGNTKEDQIKAGRPILAGVIYYQTGARTLLAHGPMSIYGRLYERLDVIGKH